MLHKSIVFGLLAALLLLGCKTKQAVVKVEASPVQMAFVTLAATKDTIRQTTTFTVKEVKVINNTFSYKPDVAKTKDAHYLKLQISNNDQSSVLVYTEHPLYKRFDLYSEAGEIESKLISLQQGEVTFRIPYYADYHKITITETINFIPSTPKIIKHEK